MASNVKPILRLAGKAFVAITLCATAVAQNRLDNSQALPEPAYQGQPLSHWIKILSGGLTSSKWWPEINEIEGGAEAREAIEHIGPVAVPFLLKWIPQRGSMIAFRILGPAAKSAIPELVAIATNQLAAARTVERPSRGIMAIGRDPMTVLGWIGPDSLPALTMILSNYNESEIRFTAIQALEIIGTNAAPATSAILPCLNDKNEMVVYEAVDLLGQIHSRQQDAFVALTNILQSIQSPSLTRATRLTPSLRAKTLEALVGFGDEAVPVLIKGMEGKNSNGHYIVGETWIKKSPQVLTNAALIKLLADGLHSSDVDARDWSALMLCAAGQQSRGVRPQSLLQRVRHWQLQDLSQIREEATNALRSLAPQLLPSNSR